MVAVAVAEAELETTAVVWILARAGGPDIRTVDALTGTPELFQLELPVERLAWMIFPALDGAGPEAMRRGDRHPGCRVRMPRKHTDLMVVGYGTKLELRKTNGIWSIIGP